MANNLVFAYHRIDENFALSRKTIMLLIGIITRDRKIPLLKTIYNVCIFTNDDFRLVVSDDGSTDGSLEALQRLGLPHFTGPTQGTAYARNRILRHFELNQEFSSVFILDDDLRPVVRNWNTQWQEVISREGYVVYNAASQKEAPMTSGCITGMSRETFRILGYYDPRFYGTPDQYWGYEDSDYSRRVSKFLRKEVSSLSHGVTHDKSSGYWVDQKGLENSRELYESISDDRIFRNYYKSAEEKAAFDSQLMKEMK